MKLGLKIVNKYEFNNQILSEHLFPEAASKPVILPLNITKNLVIW
jgi:hypothetical protein